MSLKSVCQSCIVEISGMRNRILNLIDSPIIVLLYHRVTTLPSDPHQLAVNPYNFLNQIRYLKNNFPILRFEDNWSNLKETSVVITFDDGYADNVLEALPLLEHEGVPATFFVSTGTLGSNYEYWWDELERIVLAERIFPSTFELQDERLGRKWSTRSNIERYALYHEIYPLIMQVGADRRDDWLNQLRDWADSGDKGRTTHRAMTNTELQKLASSAFVTIGAHTVSHTPLASLSSDQQQSEIFESKHQLEELTGQNITVFSYPFGGKRDYTRESIRLSRKAGFIRAASNTPGQVHSWTDSHQIPRHVVRNWPLNIFQNNVKEFSFR